MTEFLTGFLLGLFLYFAIDLRARGRYSVSKLEAENTERMIQISDLQAAMIDEIWATYHAVKDDPDAARLGPFVDYLDSLEGGDANCF